MSARVRVLAVARQSGDWWAELGRRYDSVESATDKVLRVTAPEVDDRYAAYECALQAFRSRLDAQARPADVTQAGRPEPPSVALAKSNFGSDEFANFLIILMQALVDASATVSDRFRPQAGVASADALELRLLERLLDLERQAWRRTVDPWLTADPVVLERVVAVSSLAFASDGDSLGEGEDEAAATLRLVPDLGDATEQVRRAFARWENRQYTGYGYLRALRPERLAQHVAGKLVAAFPSLASALLDVSAGNPLAPKGDVAKSYRAVNTLRLLSNAAFGAGTRPELSAQVTGALREALKTHTRTLLRLSLEMVSHDLDTPEDTAGKSLIAALESTIMRFPEAGAARDAAEVLEEDCPDVLLSLAVKVMRRATGFGEARTDATPVSDPLTHARLLRLLSRFLSDSGEKQQAREAAWEAVQESRRLEIRESNPETKFGLAHALTNLAVRLDEVGRYQEAIDAGREAVKFYEELFRAEPSRWNHVHLANGYSNLSLAAGHAGRWREALQWAMQARDLVDRDLPGGNPPDDDPGNALLAAKALSWQMASRYWAAANNHQRAVDAAQKAVACYETLKKKKPAVWTRDYARSMNTLGRRYADRKEWSTSIDCHERALVRYDELEQEYREAVRGEHADAHRDLAASYFCRYLDSHQDSDLAESTEHIQAAVQDYRRMTGQDRRARQRGYASTLRWMARIGAAGDAATSLEVAAEAARQAIEIYEQLHNPTLWDERRLAFARLVHARVLIAFADLADRSPEQAEADRVNARAERERAENRIRDLNEEEEHPDPEDIRQLREELADILSRTGK